ncbi:hornerin-like isoform X2, partial [Daubentonia madagascariensis]
LETLDIMENSSERVLCYIFQPSQEV